MAATKTQSTTKTNSAMAGGDLTKNRIALQRGFVLPSLANQPLNKRVAMSIQAELMKFGYMLSQDALNEITVEWAQEVLPFLKKTLGVGNYRPFYENFPTQVMEMTNAELYWNAVFHYWSAGTWEPVYQLKDRGFAFEDVKFTTINLGTEALFANIFTTLISINQSITGNDKLVVEWFVKNYSQLVMPATIPFKETLCMLASYRLPNVPVKTPTDVLRIAVAISGGDISLPAIPKLYKGRGRTSWMTSSRVDSSKIARDAFKFKKFSRTERGYLLSLLERTNLDLGEMKLKLGRWTRLAEILHPGDRQFKNKYKLTYNAFRILRNEPKSIKTFYARVEEAFDESLAEGLIVLTIRPGEFARRLDYLLRSYDTATVMSKFRTITSKVSRKVLWELYNHFMNRTTERPRSIMIKGAKAIRKTLEPLKPMSSVQVTKVQNEIIKAIGAQFAEMEGMGKVYLDEKLKKIPLPASMRSVSTAAKTYVRGTRVPFAPNTKTVRAYVHWFDQKGDQDIDLSADFRGADLRVLGHISYTNLRSLSFKAAHSGDIRSRQGACAEYIDVDIESALKSGVRYVMIQANNYVGRPLKTVKDCVFGVMEREFPTAGEIFQPDTIANAVAIQNESQTAYVALLDLKEKDFIWVDLETNSRELVNVESNRGNTTNMLDWLVNTEALSVYDLLLLHVESRGNLVANEKEADLIFSYDEFVTSYEKIALYM
jgi:hypothetical protein